MGYAGFVPVRQLVLVDLLGLIMATRPGERAVVGIDGVDGAGKSHLAAELLALAQRLAGRELHSVSMDGFHHPREVRYARGRSAESYYRDAFDYEAFRRHVLIPFRAGREVVPAVHDVATDQAILPDAIEAAEDAVLLVDGVFLHRPELTAVWDASLFVHVPFELSVPRGNARHSVQQAAESDPDDPEDPVHARYVQAQRWYLEQAPAQQATWVLDNSNLSQPLLDWGAEVGP
ncbi:MAG: uridine kinase [Ornithinimicrobium sp.]